MAPNIGGFLTGIIPSGSTTGLIVLLIFFGLATVLFVGGGGLIIWNKKRWNLKVEIKLPRGDGTIVNGEWGSGFFHSKRGVVYIRRPGWFQPKIALKIFDPKRYLQGSDLITVIQLSPVDYRPIHPKSYLTYTKKFKDSETGEIKEIEESVLKITCDTGHDKAWQSAFDAAAKKAYSLQSFFQQFQTPISIAITITAVFVGIAALWSQMPN